ncbi:MAG: PAS domain S-box protein [Candidatus Desulfofervidaceae bacterium]|nr:PAS domain S-box protein [Candidatus Desulfofervidaceae bacterium]
MRKLSYSCKRSASLSAHCELVNTVGKGTLEHIIHSFLEPLGISATVYEISGDCACALFSSWCRLLRSASVKSGKNLCHKSCWTETSKIAIKTGKPFDLKSCRGGLSIYAVPIIANKKIIGAISFAYGSPPRDKEALKKIAGLYQLPLEELKRAAEKYKEEPQYVVEFAKRHLHTAAELIAQLYLNQKTLRQHKASEEKYRLLFEMANDAIFLMDRNKIIDCNKKALELFGCKKEEMLNRNLYDFSPPKQPNGASSKSKAQEKIQAVLQDKPQFFEWIHSRKDGTIFYVEVSLNIFKTGEKTLILAIVRDVTERKQLEEELFQALKMEAVGTMAGGIAHDFNNILNAIIGSAEILRSKVKERKLHYWLDIIVNQSQRGALLIRQILDFSRQSYVEKEPLDLLPLVKELVKMLKRILPENIKIELDYGNTDYVVLSSPVHIQQMFMNLATNARDAMPKGGELRIKLDKRHLGKGYDGAYNVPEGEYVVISVQDTGVGMSPEVIKRAFEPFFTTKPPGKSTGLGLSQVYGIVKQHKGYIYISSELKKGTTVCICLPAAKREKERSVQEISSRQVRSKTTGAILVIEDNETVLEVLRDILVSVGHRVFIAKNGKKGLEIYSQLKDEIDLIITDLIMPEMEGTEFYTKAKEINPNLKVLFLTGYSFEENISLKEPGVKGVVLKPVEAKKLIQKVEEILQEDDT